jgi:hypothetical protein
MPISTPRLHRPPHPGLGEPPADEGRWELDLWNGSVWYSEWFRRRLQWLPHTSHRRLEDLRPNLAPGAWEMLLQGIRAHLERQEPLNLTLGVQLLGGHTEIWQVVGSAERTAAGLPVYLAGSMKDISADPGPSPQA